MTNQITIESDNFLEHRILQGCIEKVFEKQKGIIKRKIEIEKGLITTYVIEF